MRLPTRHRPASPARRRLLRAGLALLAGGMAKGLPAAPEALRFGLTPVILDDQIGFLNDWRDWLASQLGRPVTFVQRLKYRDITEAMLREELDMAWVCGLPYVQTRPFMSLVAIPCYRGTPTYHSLIITRRDLPPVDSLLALRGRIFAFSDPDSNSGYLYPTWRLHRAHTTPQAFFGKVFFTWAHRNTIDAVAAGLADAGAVDSYIYEEYRRHHPDVVAGTRVVERSPAFGFPPVVARDDLPAEDRAPFQQALLNMEHTPAGKALLSRLGLDGFVPPRRELFADIAAMWTEMSGSDGLQRAT